MLLIFLRVIRIYGEKLIKLDDKPVQDETINSVLVYFFIYMIILFTVTLLISIDGRCDLFTNFSASLTCLSNIGPGFNMIGPSTNFGPSGANYSGFSKLILGLTMLTGRLEIFPMIMLLSKKTWRREN